jgi:1-acyl-sn-glycerol-3-phosphate acyltransferase
LGSWLLELGFDLWIRACYRRLVLLPRDFHVEPGTLIASNHQRDVDGPMLGTVLVRRHGLRFEWPLPFFATREDLFRPGILARLTVHWPRPVSTLLGHVSLAWFFPLGRAEPMRRVREFTLGEALQALVTAGLGQRDAMALLNARGMRELGVHEHLPLAELATRAPPAALERWWGLRRLRPSAIAAIAATFRATVDAQLRHFAQHLERGRCVYFAPEGTISMDGHFSRIRDGCFRLVHLTRTPPWIQPMVIGYDTLAPGRSRVVVRIGPRWRADTSLDRRAFDATLRRNLLDLVPVTPSHLLARYLLHGPDTFTQDELTGWLARSLTTLEHAHRSLDPLFARKGIRALADERLRWLERKRLVVRRGAHFRSLCPRDAEPGWHTPANIARYLDNNLLDLVPETARTLPC